MKIEIKFKSKSKEKDDISDAKYELESFIEHISRSTIYDIKSNIVFKPLKNGYSAKFNIEYDQ